MSPGFTRTPPKMLTEEELYPSIIHTTPERRKYSAAEWDAFTKESTEKALEELVASPDFGKWLSNNADRISVTPNSSTDRRRRWLLWSWATLAFSTKWWQFHCSSWQKQRGFHTSTHVILGVSSLIHKVKREGQCCRLEKA